MIIPQISNADKEDHGVLYYMEHPFFEIPEVCPICGGPVEIVCENESEVLMCKNADCDGQLINRLDHFCGKKGLDIKGLSKATLEKLINWNWVDCYEDLFNLSEFQYEWKKKPGFGERSVHNILVAIEESRICTLEDFIAALGIPLVGSKVSKELCKYFPTWQEFRNAVDSNYKFFNLNGFGDVLHYNIINFNYEEADILVEKYIFFKKEDIAPEDGSVDTLNGLNIVITGKLNHFKNRAELQTKIENAGGKVVSSVSKNTSILINNDNTSTSSKNLSAKKLDIPIMTEDEFLKKYF
jgi:DNA ligase (NAD+)